jgi:transposase
MKKRYIVKLTSEEREHLEELIHRGRHAADRRRRAQILLLVDEGEFGPALPDIEAAQTMNVSRRNVEMVRERCVMEGLEQAVDRKKRTRERSRKLDGEAEAQLIQLACSEAPEGQARWTVRLLADRLVELEVVESISRECVRQALKKMS